MAGPGQIPGRYNIVVKGEYDTFDHQVPVSGFIEQLQDDNVPDEVCVVGLGKAFSDGELAEVLAREMDNRANDLENRHPLPTIQFAVEGTFHRRRKTFDLRIGDQLYPLQEVFGSQIEREGESNWLVAPF